MFLEGVVPADAAATDVGTLGGDDATSMEASAVPSKCAFLHGHNSCGNLMD
jgi:hypothetical protein